MPEDDSRQKVTEAEFVYVAIDESRRIRRLEPKTTLVAAN
jgi:acyl-CoA thioesterase YciA